jgi:uncharacterized protein (TIGR02147 family)
MKPIYTYQNYKKYLKDMAALLGRGSIGKLALAAGCNRTYLSQCLTTKVQLTPDHIMGMADYLNLSEDEMDYLVLLLLFERSASETAQARIKKKMDRLVQANLVLSRKISSKGDSDELTEPQKTKYYSSWKYAAIHTLASIRDYQTTPSMAKKTRLPEAEVASVLMELEDMGLIRYDDERWVHTKKNIHIPTGYSHTTQNHLNWRLKSVEDVNNKSSIHYTTLFSLSKNDWESLREQLLAFIDAQRDFIHASGTDEMYSFCCDLFRPLEN